MALKSGRVGVRPDQVDAHGRLIATDYLIDILRDELDTESAEVAALQLARQHLLEELERPIITPIEDPVIEPIDEPIIKEEESEVKTNVTRSRKSRSKA